MRRRHAATLWNYPFQSEKDTTYFIYLAHDIHSKLNDPFTVTLNSVSKENNLFIVLGVTERWCPFIRLNTDLCSDENDAVADQTWMGPRVLFELDSIVHTEGSIIDPCHEVWK